MGLTGCRSAIGRWRVPPALSARVAMALWLLVLLVLFETLAGVALFHRTVAGTWAGLADPAELIGLTAQMIAALLSLLVRRNVRGWRIVRIE